MPLSLSAPLPLLRCCDNAVVFVVCGVPLFHEGLSLVSSDRGDAFQEVPLLFVAGGEVVPEHDDAPARLAPHVAEAVVGEVGHPRSRGDIDTAIRSKPAIGA